VVIFCQQLRAPALAEIYDRSASFRAAARASAATFARSTRSGMKSSTNTSPSTIVVRTSLPRAA
jgi:hypothetical protein